MTSQVKTISYTLLKMLTQQIGTYHYSLNFGDSFFILTKIREFNKMKN